MHSAAVGPGHVVVVGGGMVAHRFAEQLCSRADAPPWRMTVIGEEPHRPYDRVHLSEVVGGRTVESLTLDPSPWDDERVTLVVDERVIAIDLAAQTVTTHRGRVEHYDTLVLATGSRPWVPRTEGTDLPGVLCYRTLGDIADLQSWVRDRSAALGRPLRGAVVGGGVLGLEAAAALQTLGVEQPAVVEFADRLMAVQLDAGGGETLRQLVTERGMDVRTGAGAERVLATGDGAVGGLVLTTGDTLDVDVLVYSTGIRPRDRQARECGLAVAERGGVVVGPTCRTSDPAVWAIGECASVDGECAGLIAPGNAMADVVVDQLCGGIRSYARTPDGTKLKGAGVDAASFGDVLGLTPGALEVTFADPVARTYRKLVVSDDARLLLGGVFVGDTDLYAQLRPLLGRPLGADPSAFLAQGGGPVVTDVPDDVVLCSCSNVTAGTVRAAVTEHGCRTVGEVKTCTRAGTVCGSCVPLLTKVVNTTLEQAGFEVSSAMCEHFAMSRAELFALVRTEGLRTFTEVVSRHGRGRGCAICRPVVASILASLGIGHVLSSDQAPLQDTNDHLLANLQKDGTYSVVPRMPGGEVTPEKLLAFAEVARDFGLFTRITGAQRIGMFGARQDQLPEIWRRLVDAGFESGHAYGKSLRQVKTCIGATWCRFGVQDSASMAVRLELRYRGLRAPHKFKMGVSGCARECAEARAKDVGVIATEKGWNVYVGGNGGFTPRHADLLAEDLDDARMIQVVDRFLALYVRRGDRLQRTAPFVAGFPGGIEELRRVVVEDSEGIGAELDAEIERHVASYADEWRTTLEDPEKLRRFTPYVNAPGVGDPDLAYVPERGQARPARPGEHGVPDLRTARALETQP
jgi:nitrite reductase (NADH) large subunit